MNLTDFHGYQNSVRWRLTPQGIEIQGTGIERTPGAPDTVTSIWERFSGPINAASERYGVPCVLIVATAATETGGVPWKVREEPGYKSDVSTPNKVSPGLMQTLISTARDAMNDPSIDRAWLLNPANSIMAGTAYIAQQKPKTEFDPPKAAAAYNAGGIYRQESKANRWKMRQFPIGTGEHCDRFVRWFNDAVAVLGSHPVRPTVPYSVLLGGDLNINPVAPVSVVRRSAVVVIKAGVVIESQECKAMVEYMRQSGVACRVTSAKRSALPSDHAKQGTGGKGLAVDFAGLRESQRDTQEMADIFNALAKIGQKLDELIYAGPQVKQNVKLGKWVPKYAQDDHHDHVHGSVPKGVFIKWPGNGREDEMQRVVRTTRENGSEWPGRYLTDDLIVSYIGTGSRLEDLETRFGPAQPMPRQDFDQLVKINGAAGWPE